MTTAGKGRVGAVKGQSRPLIFLKGVETIGESTWADRESGWRQYGVDQADVYMEFLADWDCEVGSAGEYRYRVKSSPRRD